MMIDLDTAHGVLPSSVQLVFNQGLPNNGRMRTFAQGFVAEPTRSMSFEH